jgi:hypothetical protein
LKKYQVKQVTDFFVEISSPNYTNLKEEHKDKLIYAFGYYKSSSYDQTDYIFHLLKEIAGVYVFYLNSYNAYKHGHRVWYGYDLPTQRTNSLFYIERENKSNNYSMDYVPLDDDIITKFIMPRSKDCQTLFELILKNNMGISTKTRWTATYRNEESAWYDKEEYEFWVPKVRHFCFYYGIVTFSKLF